MVPPVSNVEPNFEVIGMKAVVLNSMRYSLSFRCSFARAPWFRRAAEDWIWGKGRARNQHGGLRLRPVRRASITQMGMQGQALQG
jgi:hypothetical protein